MGEEWYCSYRCFAAAADARFAALVAERYLPCTHVPRMSLGLRLVRNGELSAEQLRTGTEVQRSAGGEIGDVLVRLGFVSEAQITAVRAAQWGCPVFAVQRVALPAMAHIPHALMRAYVMAPVHYSASANRLLVGFVQAVDYSALYGVEQLTGCKTRACFITRSEYEAQCSASDGEAEDLLFEGITSSTEMARILCSYGVLESADEVEIARCKEHLWSRLRCRSRAVDILFRIDRPPAGHVPYGALETSSEAM